MSYLPHCQTYQAGFEDIIRSRGSVRMSYIIHNARDGVNNTPREGASLRDRIQGGLLVK